MIDFLVLETCNHSLTDTPRLNFISITEMTFQIVAHLVPALMHNSYNTNIFIFIESFETISNILL